MVIYNDMQVYALNPVCLSCNEECPSPRAALDPRDRTGEHHAFGSLHLSANLLYKSRDYAIPDVCALSLGNNPIFNKRSNVL